jgi:hypothetical protein
MPSNEAVIIDANQGRNVFFKYGVLFPQFYEFSSSPSCGTEDQT